MYTVIFLSSADVFILTVRGHVEQISRNSEFGNTEVCGRQAERTSLPQHSWPQLYTDNAEYEEDKEA